MEGFCPIQKHRGCDTAIVMLVSFAICSNRYRWSRQVRLGNEQKDEQMVNYLGVLDRARKRFDED